MSFFVAGPYDDGDAVTGHYYEVAHGTQPQVWAYTGALSYAPGDTVVLYGMSTAASARVTVVRDGITPETVLRAEIAMGFHPTPPDCSVRGCDWPEVWRFAVPDWRSGVYVITLVIEGHSSQHMFVVRATSPQNRLVMVLTTGTWCAYNDWGGSNHYQGLLGPRQTDPAHEVSLLRPWARGFVRWPDGAPRIPHASPLLTRPRYPHMDYARARGISKKYASSGWAVFERPFALWCEAQGIGLDYITQHDLHRYGMPGHARAVIAGHDEYWTWQMRDHLEAWLDKGGQLARFAGNFYWQTRLSDDLMTQTCWKTGPDPVKGARRSTYWDAPEVGRPAVATMGLTGSMGVYAGWSRCAAHGSGGFAIYRPDHWSLTETGLGYGDVLGAQAKIFAYEVDGVEYGMKHGLPFADDPALQGDLTIIAMSPATTLSHHTSPADRDLFIGHLDAEDTARMIYGAVTPETMGRASRGNGCIAEYHRGRGAVFNAGSCEWVNGLILADPTVERVTRRVLTGEWG